MLENVLSETAKKLYIALFIVGMIGVGYLILTESPSVEWLVDIRQSIFPSGRKALMRTITIAVFPVACVTFILALCYDILTKQGKFER